jgi:diguanylate cyclase (GGDEF)-like protein/PAS domain S-box-containing protein
VEATGREVTDLIVPPSARPAVEAIGTRLRAGDLDAHSFNENVTRDGRTLLCEWFNTPLQDASGEFAGFLSMGQDMTERERAAEQLRLAGEVFENASEGIVVTDASAAILSVNRAFTAITGYSAEEVSGQNPRFLASGQHDRAFFEGLWGTIAQTGHWQGEVWNRRKDGEAYPQWLSITTVRNDAGEATHHIGVFSDISERKAADERVRFLAQHDPLTSLPNRALIMDRLEHALASALRSGNRVALLFVDLDRFKTVNDSLGHHVGDRLLQHVAERLRECVRETDTVARLGGDEFLVLLPELRTMQGASDVAEKVLRTLAAPATVEGHELTISPSIGISVYPTDGANGETLLKNADAAMYHAKERGRNNFQFYTEDMNARALETLTLEKSLRRALAGDELRLHYQPQVDLASGRICGAEALVRWSDPDGNPVPPTRFLSVAEERGLILPLGEWVLREACAQNRRWQDAGLPPLPVAVNVSPQQFRQRDLPGQIRAILDETGLAPAFLELEMTEAVLVPDADVRLDMLRELRDMGLSLAVDDFGTGYSSLSYLSRFPLRKLKVDLSFIRGLDDNPHAAAITRAVIAMARSLDLRVVAEGVENEHQLELLRQLGCDEIQGHLFCPPVTAEALADLLRSERQLLMRPSWAPVAPVRPAGDALQRTRARS